MVDILAVAQIKVVAQTDFGGIFGQCRLADNGGADLSHIALLIGNVAEIQIIADDQGQNGVAEKLQALVALDGNTLGLQLIGIGGVIQGRLQKRRILERISQFFLQKILGKRILSILVSHCISPFAAGAGISFSTYSVISAITPVFTKEAA